MSIPEPKQWPNLPEPQNAQAVDLQYKWYTWPLIRSGDCTLFEGAKWTLYSDGTAQFDATVTSGDDSDSWVINRVALFDANGALLTFLSHSGPWSADHNQQFWKDLPDSSQRYRWFDAGYFSANLFPLINSMQLQGCHC